MGFVKRFYSMLYLMLVNVVLLHYFNITLVLFVFVCMIKCNKLVECLVIHFDSSCGFSFYYLCYYGGQCMLKMQNRFQLQHGHGTVNKLKKHWICSSYFFVNQFKLQFRLFCKISYIFAVFLLLIFSGSYNCQLLFPFLFSFFFVCV